MEQEIEDNKDQEMTLGKLKGQIQVYLKERNWDLEARDLAISISLEAAELLEHYQWSNDYEEQSQKNFSEIKKELADVMIYCLEFAIVNDIDISKAIQEKLEYNAKKYPPKVSPEEYYKIKESYRTQ